MKQSLDLPLQQQINSICLQFEDEWQSGRAPLIGDYLPMASTATKDAVLRELILLDVDYRQQEGMALDVEEYVWQLPDQEMTVRGIFQATHPRMERSIQSQLDTSQVAGHSTQVPRGTNKHLNRHHDQATVGRYRLEERIGDGGFGVVYPPPPPPPPAQRTPSYSETWQSRSRTATSRTVRSESECTSRRPAPLRSWIIRISCLSTTSVEPLMTESTS